MPPISNRQSELRTALSQLHLTAMADAFADVALRAAKEGLSHEAYLGFACPLGARTTHPTADGSHAACFRASR